MAKRRTILINHLMEPPHRVTGVTRFLFALLQELATNQAFDYVLLTTWDADRLPMRIAKSSVRVFTRRFRQSTPQNILAQMTIVPQVMRETCAAVEFNCNPIGCFLPNWPRVITVHDFYFDLLPEKYPFRHRLWWRLFLPICMAAASKIICVSANTLSDLHRFYPRFANKGVVVHEASALMADLSSATNNVIKLREPYAIYVGNISPNKNPTVLALALKILERKGRSTTVYHIGQDDSLLLDRAVKAAGLTHPVQTLGPISDSMLASAYASADCMIASSTHEGFCLPVIEAQSYGTPVVCSDIPVLREVAGNGALFFNPHDAEELATCIEKVFNDKHLRQRLSLAGRQNAARFSWARAAGEVEELFNAVSKG